MSQRTKIDVLFDSVITINNELSKNNSKRVILKANADHIKLCLDKDDYKKDLSAEQVASLNKAVEDAEAKIVTLPAPEKKSK